MIRVANYAAAALVNFSENAKKDVITPYIEVIITKLLVLMGTGKIFVQEQAVTTLSTVAESAGTHFATVSLQLIVVLFPNHARTFANPSGSCSEGAA